MIIGKATAFVAQPAELRCVRKSVASRPGLRGISRTVVFRQPMPATVHLRTIKVDMNALPS